MIRPAWGWLGVAIVVGSACQPTLDGPIDYRRTGGWGAQLAATHIEMTGAATVSHRCAAPVTRQLDDAAVASVQRMLSIADLSTLTPRYVRCVDCGYETISAQLGGRLYTVVVDSGSPHVPARLRVLLDTLRVLAGDGPGEDVGCGPAAAATVRDTPG